jgi:hypothetical protein
MSIRDLKTKTIELSVGLTLVLGESNWRMSRKKEQLETLANDAPLLDQDDQLFASTFYPLLAAAVVSDNCPTLEQCLTQIPEEDLELWYTSVKELNPHWFEFMDTVAKLLAEQESSDTETKKEPDRSLTEGESKPV